MQCRHCKEKLSVCFLDLGFSPPSNAYFTKETASELYFPLRVMVCHSCFLVQTEDHTKADTLFTNDYAYFSSTSSSWLTHAKTYVSKMVSLIGLDQKSFVVEIAANDGYLLKNVVSKGIPCVGIEPTQCTAKAAEALNIPMIKEFFTSKFSSLFLEKYPKADLIIGNNVYAHVPDIHDFTKGLKKILKHNGVITLEFPHLLQLIKNDQFDTVYHEHFSYLSLSVVHKIFHANGLKIWDVEELNTHGGSLRVYGIHESDERTQTPNVNHLLTVEDEFGLNTLSRYGQFQEKVNTIKYDLLTFLIQQKKLGKKIMGYGAAAKGNTFLNYAGIKPDLMSCIYDAAPSKQGKLTPGSHIPIESPEKIQKDKPDFLLILPWNLSKEISTSQAGIRDWGGKFITAVPELKVF